MFIMHMHIQQSAADIIQLLRIAFNLAAHDFKFYIIQILLDVFDQPGIIFDRFLQEIIDQPFH